MPETPENTVNQERQSPLDETLPADATPNVHDEPDPDSEAVQGAESESAQDAGNEPVQDAAVDAPAHDEAASPAATEASEASVEPEAAQPNEEPAPQPAAKETARPAAVEAEPVELVRPGMGWYVLRVASNKEDQVRDALERKVKIEQLEQHVGRVLVPTRREKRVRGGTSRVYHLKLYPGYVFVEMATDSDGRIPENVWFVIKETTGVGDFIGSGGKPSPMLMPDVEKMLAAAISRDDSPALTSIAFKQGDRVKVTEGPFENFEGTVEEVDAQKGQIKLVVSIFGRPTPIDIEYWKLEAV